ncbi:DUF3105 domain-containing protein [Candidatus Gottesmanbacteria bacterium]|nr:DUF3105 domain-containing protein [Candidatus Gottesmanbacteria bacterium]
MSTDKKVIISTGLATLVILVGGVYWATKQGERSSKPLVGQEVAIESRNHVPDTTKIDYNSNPPAGGDHYARPQDAGIYDKAPADGNLVHSLEHGAIILWHNPDLPSGDIDTLKKIYYKASGGKKIMTQRKSLDVPVALSSWGRVLKLRTIDEKQIMEFFETNRDRGPEQAPI